MANRTINKFISGIHNVLASGVIPKDAASSSSNWVTKDGRIVLAGGRSLSGAEGAVGKISGLHFGYKSDGTKILYRKNSTAIQYLNGATWTNIITGLTADADYTFANYTSLAGYFTYIGGVDGLYKINNANPGSYTSLYDAAKNDKGYIMIDRGRMIMWNCVNASKTTLKLSHIDDQLGTYTQVTNEAIGIAGSANYNGTLAFKAGGAYRTCFGVQFEATVVAGTETFVDNKNGTLTSNYGGTGTINYTSGVYSVTFSAVTTGAVTSDYTWEDSNVNGITDFTFSATRLASEGNRITQDIGGDKIMAVYVGQDGAYYSIKEQSAYKLTIADDDLTFTNLVYRQDIGMPFFRAGISTSKGIIFMNTANPDKPELTILQRNPLGDNIEPVNLARHFRFEDYEYDDACIDTWERFIIIACKTPTGAVNDTILLFNQSENTVDVTAYDARCFAKDSGILYTGSAISQTVYKTFNGYDDNDLTIENYWIGKDEDFGSDKLKKIRRLRFQGLIDPDQSIEVWVNYDSAGFQQIGTIVGSGSYVDYTSPFVVGASPIGDQQIGGDDDSTAAYPFYVELKLSPLKFQSRTIKLIAKGIGYVDFNTQTDWDILLFESRIPKRYRSKQNVSLDGLTTNN